jgi:hypothetical protein
MDANMETRTKKFFERAMRTSQLRDGARVPASPSGVLDHYLIRIVAGKIGIDPALIEKKRRDHALSLRAATTWLQV